MSIILRKEQIQTSKLISQKFSQTTIDCDVIVPDINPDIKKILEVSGYIAINEKTLLGGKVYIQGTAYMTVLYVPDGEVLNKVKSLHTSQPFSHSIDIGQHDEDIDFCADIETEGYNYSLINSRKINLRCTLGINIKLSDTDTIEIALHDSDSGDICTKTQKICLCDTPVSSENRIVLSYQVELPPGNPSVGEILKTAVYPESSELILMENSAIAKGQVRLCVLYTSLDDGSVQSAEYNLPFEETLDIVGLEEDMEAEIEYLSDHIYCEIQDDSDGEPRIFNLETGLSTHLRGIKIQEPEIICDAYSLKGNTSCISKPVTIEQLVSNTTAQLTHKASLSIPDSLPEISKICDVSISASVDRISVDSKEITVYGHVKSTILYTTNDEAYPLCSYQEISEFTHSLPSTYTSTELICEAKIFTEHTSYTMNGPGGIDLRVVLGLSVRSFTESIVSPITDVEIIDSEEHTKKPSICIFFVQKGDTLWNIAKRYKTTVERLKEINNLACDDLSIGQQIRVC